jgi:hypothetical protein
MRKPGISQPAELVVQRLFVWISRLLPIRPVGQLKADAPDRGNARPRRSDVNGFGSGKLVWVKVLALEPEGPQDQEDFALGVQPRMSGGAGVAQNQHISWPEKVKSRHVLTSGPTPMSCRQHQNPHEIVSKHAEPRGYDGQDLGKTGDFLPVTAAAYYLLLLSAIMVVLAVRCQVKRRYPRTFCEKLYRSIFLSSVYLLRPRAGHATRRCHP